MRRNLIHAIKHEVALLNDEPERVAPVPRVVLDDAVRVDLDPEVEGDERPAECPAGDVREDGVVGREGEVRDGEERVGEKVAAVRRAVGLACVPCKAHWSHPL